MSGNEQAHRSNRVPALEKQFTRMFGALYCDIADSHFPAYSARGFIMKPDMLSNRNFRNSACQKHNI